MPTRARLRTRLFLAHIEMMFDRWDEMAKTRRDRLRRQLTRAHYLVGVPIAELIEQEGCSEALIADNLRIAQEELTVLLFGAGGVFRAVATADGETQVAARIG